VQTRFWLDSLLCIASDTRIHTWLGPNYDSGSYSRRCVEGFPRIVAILISLKLRQKFEESCDYKLVERRDVTVCMNTWTWLGSTFFGQLTRRQVWSEGMVANQLCRIVVGISSQIGRDGHLDMGDVSTGRAASRGALATRHLHHARGIQNLSKKTFFFSFYWVQPMSIYWIIERHVISIHCIERHVSMTQCIDT